MEGLAVVKDPRALFDLLKSTYQEWSEDKASRLAAALAYYTIFSIAPLLLIAITVAGLVFGRAAAEGQVVGQLEGLIGPDGAGVIQTAIANAQQSGASTVSAIIGIAALIWSASNLFSQLQDALNTIWEVQPDPEAGLVGTAKRRVLSMTMVLGIGFLLLVSLVLSAAISAVGNFIGGLLPGGSTLWQFVNTIVSFGIITLLFAAIYKILPDATIAWSDVWIGAAVTALLFSIGKLLIGLYLGYASVGSTFGAAGSLLVLLVWVYYSAQILFFGAEFTQVYARRYGSHIAPAGGAVAVNPDDRARQGIPDRETVQKKAAEQTEREPVAGAPRQLVAARGRTGAAGRPENASVPHANGRAENGSRVNGHAQNGQLSGNESGQRGTRRHERGSGGTKGAPDTVKKVMWAGVVSGSMALGAFAARRASAEIWRGIFREDPPTKNV